MVPLGRCPELGILSHGDASADTASDLHVTQPQCTVLRDAVADAEWAEGLGSDEWGRGGDAVRFVTSSVSSKHVHVRVRCFK